MGCDMVLALGRATADGRTLFGRNATHPATVCRLPGRTFAADEIVRATHVRLPQARQTFTVVGTRPDGAWGLDLGLNEKRVVAGCLDLRPTLHDPAPGLLGTDVVRLVLERAHSAQHAGELFIDLVQRHGLGAFAGCPESAERDHAFVLADPAEAYVIETAGRHWVVQEVQEVRAVTGVRAVRQDWDRVSPGLASHVIARGWWPDDGSKLDFAGALGENPARYPAEMRRWGRASQLLQEQNGHIDAGFFRRVVADHGGAAADDTVADDGLCPHTNPAGSFLTDLSADPAQAPVLWCALGPPCTGVFFPIVLDAEFPGGGDALADACRRAHALGAELDRTPLRRAVVRDRFERLQERIDHELDEFLREALAWRLPDERGKRERLAGLFMEHQRERFDEVLAECLNSRPVAAHAGLAQAPAFTG